MAGASAANKRHHFELGFPVFRYLDNERRFDTEGTSAPPDRALGILDGQGILGASSAAGSMSIENDHVSCPVVKNTWRKYRMALKFTHEEDGLGRCDRKMRVHRQNEEDHHR